MTLKEVLDIVIKDLESIRIPVSELDGIGQPVARSVSNLKTCIAAMEQFDKEFKEKEAQKEAEQDNVVPMNQEDEQNG